MSKRCARCGRETERGQCPDHPLRFRTRWYVLAAVLIIVLALVLA